MGIADFLISGAGRVAGKLIRDGVPQKAFKDLKEKVSGAVDSVKDTFKEKPEEKK
jgi:hypothetical protein